MQVPGLDDMTTGQLAWLVPLLFGIYNTEQAPKMAQWKKRLPSGRAPDVTTMQFTLAALMLTVVTLIVAAAVYFAPQSRVALYAILLVQASVFFNTFVPHLVATIRFRIYSPGVVSGVLLNIPFSIYFFARIAEIPGMGVISLVISLALSPLMTWGMALGSLKLADRILGRIKRH